MQTVFVLLLFFNSTSQRLEFKTYERCDLIYNKIKQSKPTGLSTIGCIEVVK
jgi:hypothetical protein